MNKILVLLGHGRIHAILHDTGASAVDVLIVEQPTIDGDTLEWDRIITGPYENVTNHLLWAEGTQDIAVLHQILKEMDQEITGDKRDGDS